MAKKQEKTLEQQLADQGYKRIPDRFDEDTGARMEVWEFKLTPSDPEEDI